MSLVIAIKDKDRIILGADKQVSTNTIASHDCIKIWEVEGLPGAIMGGVGSLRASQVCQYNNFIDLNDISTCGVNTAFIVKSIAPSLVNLLSANGVKVELAKDEETQSLMLPNAFLFAYEDQAWMIWNDLSVTEIEDYLVIGSGSDVAKGVLYATQNKNPFERIITAIDAAAENTLFVDHGVDLLATKYEKKDKALINKAFGLVTETKSKTDELASKVEDN